MSSGKLPTLLKITHAVDMPVKFCHILPLLPLEHPCFTNTCLVKPDLQQFPSVSMSKANTLMSIVGELLINDVFQKVTWM